MPRSPIGELSALAPNDRLALHELGLVFERTSRFEELVGLLEDASRSGIGKSELPDLWAICALRAGHPDEARALLRQAPPGSDPVHWNRLRAKVFDATGDAPAAFAAAAAMNAAAPDFAHWRSRGAVYRAELRDRRSQITRERAERMPRLAQISAPKLAFLVGFPRSGTTLADTFLMGHPQCRVLEELPILLDEATRLAPLSGLHSRSPHELTRAQGSYLDRLRKAMPAAEAQVIVDKFPLNMTVAPLIASLFPGVPIIHVQRHPCDAVLSGFMQSFAQNTGNASFLDLHDAADFYDCVMHLWQASRESLELNVHTLVYEQLVRDPETALRPVVEFLDLPWDAGLLNHQATAKRRGPIANTSYNQVTEPLHKAPVGRWKRYHRQLEPVLPVLLPWAERLGYTD